MGGVWYIMGGVLHIMGGVLKNPALQKRIPYREEGSPRIEVRRNSEAKFHLSLYFAVSIPDTIYQILNSYFHPDAFRMCRKLGCIHALD
jgi:hypothetical protein